MTTPDLTRRVFAGAAVLGVSVPLLAACGSDEDTGGSGSASESPSSASPSPSPSDSGPTAEEGLVATGDVPLNGGVILEDAEVVVVQPAEGEFRCFSAICTHAGCVVASVADNRIQCDCHGSVFSAEDGSVVNGPASSPLEAVEVTVSGDQVTRA
jgi:Rieske Fe-S protein